MTTDIDERIRNGVGAIARNAPAPHPYAQLRNATTTHITSHRRHHRRAGLIAAAAALAFVGVTATGIALLRTAGSPQPSGDSGMVALRHYSISYNAESNAVCDAAEPPTAGRFRESQIDVWVDAANHQARMRTTYPDGSTRNLVTFGDGPVPDRVFERGDDRSELIGCGLHTGSFLDPGSAPFIPIVGVAVQLSPRETIVPGEHRDSLGRVAQVWTSSSPGGIDSPGQHVAMTDEHQRYVDPESHQLLELVATSRWGTGAVVTYRVVYRAADTTTVSSSIFSTDGYREVSSAHTSATTEPSSRPASPTKD